MPKSSVLSMKMEELAYIADSVLTKKAAVDAATLAGGGAPPMDPAAMGMDPAAMGMDPAAMGMDPSAMGGGAPPGPDPLEQRLAALEAQLAAGGSGGAGAGIEPIKPKIDVNVEIMRMNKMIARIADALGVKIPAAEMVATQDDLTQMGLQNSQSGAGGGGGSAISPIEPMQGASPSLAGGGSKIASQGEVYDGSGLASLQSKADALYEMMSANG